MTNHMAQYKEHLRALFKDEPEQSENILAGMGDGPWEGTGRLNLAVFGMAASKRFANDKSHEAVAKFVAEASKALSSAEAPPNPLHIELLVRSALGETALFDEVPDDVRNTIMPIAAYLMISDIGLSSAQIDQLLDEAEAAVA